MDKVQGVFSTTGEGPDDKGSKSYWAVTDLGEDGFEVRRLGANYVPTGEPKVVSRTAFTATFEPEPEFFVKSAAGKKGGKPGKALGGTDPSAVQSVNEKNILANFNLGLMLLKDGDKERADKVFERILAMEGPFEAEHKHLFNSCGIALRKAGRYDKALRFYRKAARLSTDDENLFHNMARAQFEKGDMQSAMTSLNKSLQLNPELRESRQFMRFLKKRFQRPAQAKYYRAPYE